MTTNKNELITEYLDQWTRDYLRDKSQATDEELLYLIEFMQLRDQKTDSISNFNSSNPSLLIDDFLYHGDIWHAGNFKLLKDLGIQHILNVSDTALKEDITTNFNVLWISIGDHPRVNISQHFEKTNDFLFSCKVKNEKVLVHCEMGISRSSSIVLAYLMKYHHDNLLKAYTYVLERRPISMPNSGFLLQLIRYEKLLRENNIIDNKRNDDDKENPIKTLDTSS